MLGKLRFLHCKQWKYRNLKLTIFLAVSYLRFAVLQVFADRLIYLFPKNGKNDIFGKLPLQYGILEQILDIYGIWHKPKELAYIYVDSSLLDRKMQIDTMYFKKQTLQNCILNTGPNLHIFLKTYMYQGSNLALADLLNASSFLQKASRNCHHLLFLACGSYESNYATQHMLYGKQCRSWSASFFRSWLIWIHTVCKEAWI